MTNAYRAGPRDTLMHALARAVAADPDAEFANIGGDRISFGAIDTRANAMARGLAGLGFGISDVAIKALSGDLDSGPVGFLSPWSVVIITAAVFSFYASARSLQIGEGVEVIAITSVAANLGAILGGIVVFHEPIGSGAAAITARFFAFCFVIAGAALMPAPMRASLPQNGDKS